MVALAIFVRIRGEVKLAVGVQYEPRQTDDGNISTDLVIAILFILDELSVPMSLVPSNFRGFCKVQKAREKDYLRMISSLRVILKCLPPMQP